MIRPLGNKALVSLIREEVTPSGLLVAHTTKADPKFGTVVAIGPGRHVGEHFIPTTVEAGDLVQWSRWNGQEIEVDGAKYHLIPETEIIAVLDKGHRYE